MTGPVAGRRATDIPTARQETQRLLRLHKVPLSVKAKLSLVLDFCCLQQLIDLD